MSETDINKQAFDQAQKELLERKVQEVKGYILETLEKTEQKKREKERIEEELRILKLDLEDLRKGNFEKIEERKEKSRVARNISVTADSMFTSLAGSLLHGSSFTNPYNSTLSVSNGDWQTYTSGTYALSDGTVFYFGGSN